MGVIEHADRLTGGRDAGEKAWDFGLPLFAGSGHQIALSLYAMAIGAQGATIGAYQGFGW